jgi:hypothetical protein
MQGISGHITSQCASARSAIACWKAATAAAFPGLTTTGQQGPSSVCVHCSMSIVGSHAFASSSELSTAAISAAQSAPPAPLDELVDPETLVDELVLVLVLVLVVVLALLLVEVDTDVLPPPVPPPPVPASSPHPAIQANTPETTKSLRSIATSRKKERVQPCMPAHPLRDHRIDALGSTLAAAQRRAPSASK